MTEIKLSIYFTNHLDKVIKIDNNLVDIEDGILEISNKKIYNSFTFVTNEIYYDPTIINDNKNRIEVKYKIGDDDIKSFYFGIYDIEFLENNNIKVYCKSLSYKYTKNKLNVVISASSVKDLITILLTDVELNFDNFTDIPLATDYSIEDKTIEDVVNDLSKITDFDYYFYHNVLYFEDKKVIKVEDVEKYTFTTLKDIEDFSTITNKDNIVNKVYINPIDDEVIAEPQIILDIKDSPQCCSPDDILEYKDEENGNIYRIYPKNATFTIYYTPLFIEPQTNLNTQTAEKVVVEKYQLENDYFVRLSAGIKEIIAVDGVDNWSYKENYNVLVFDKVESGELKISYKTNVLYGVIEHSKYPKDVKMNIKHYNQVIDYIHKIELNGYYPLDYEITLSLISDFGIEPENAINKGVVLYYKNSDTYSDIGTIVSDNFGDIKFTIEKYGNYRFYIEDFSKYIYMDYYVNKKEIYMDLIND